MGVIQTGSVLLTAVTADFHVLIDNRVVAMASSPATLGQMQPHSIFPLWLSA